MSLDKRTYWILGLVAMIVLAFGVWRLGVWPRNLGAGAPRSY